MLPIFANTMELLKDDVPQLMAIIHVAPNEHVEGLIASSVRRWPVPVVLIPGGATHLRYDAFSVRPICPTILTFTQQTHCVKTCSYGRFSFTVLV